MQDREREESRTDRKQPADKAAAERAPRDGVASGDASSAKHDDDGGTASRVRGHTEDPDKTL